MAYNEINNGANDAATSGSVIGPYADVRTDVLNAEISMYTQGVKPAAAVKAAAQNVNSSISRLQQPPGRFLDASGTSSGERRSVLGRAPPERRRPPARADALDEATEAGPPGTIRARTAHLLPATSARRRRSSIGPKVTTARGGRKTAVQPGTSVFSAPKRCAPGGSRAPLKGTIGMVVRGTETVGLAAYQVLFAHSSEGVLFWTQEGRIMAANPAACAMLDMSDEAICALGRDGLVDQEDPRWGIAVAERERTGSAVGVARLRRGDGRFIEIEMTALQFRDDGGAAQTCCILRDMSGRMAIERELEELSARLLQLSRGDELTGFQNRRGLIATGTQLLQFADREGAPVHALFVDVGNVQQLNERLGHQAGDAALQAVARALSVTFRKNDVLARIGGTQFLVLTVHLEESECAAMTARIREHLGAPATLRVRRRPGGGPLRLDDAPGRRAHLARGPDGPVRLGHAGVQGRPPGLFRVVPGRPRLSSGALAARRAPDQGRSPSSASCAIPDQAA